MAATDDLRSGNEWLPAGGQPGECAAARRIERFCRCVIDGRRAARALAHWAAQWRLSEPELQLLWQLRIAPDDGIDQRTLAQRLALSPAQVSTSVDRLREVGWIAQHSCQGDRRRHPWRLSPDGRAVLAAIVAHADRLCDENRREAAA